MITTTKPLNQNKMTNDQKSWEEFNKLEPKQEIGFKIEKGKRTETFYQEPKQETLEEAAIINCESITHPYCDREKAMFIKGAKWQQERMYSEEEVRKLFNQYKNHFSIYRNIQILNAEFEEWFEQFKKK